MNWDTKDAVSVRVTNKDCLIVCGDDEIPCICPNCKGKVDLFKKLSINHSIKSYKCTSCGYYLVHFHDWQYMPNREYYRYEFEPNAQELRAFTSKEKIIESRIEYCEKKIKSTKRKLDSLRIKKHHQEIKDEEENKKAIVKRNGEPLGKKPKQRKRSLFS